MPIKKKSRAFAPIIAAAVILSRKTRAWRHMKPIVVTLFLALALISGLVLEASIYGKSSSHNPSNAATHLAHKPNIVIGLEDTFPPMSFRDNNGELVGFDIDLAREAARRMNMEISFKLIDWITIEDELANKGIDAIWNGFAITEKRKKTILFSRPYMQNHQIVMVNSTSAIQSKADLKGKRIGVQEGTTSVEALQKEKGLAQSVLEVKLFTNNLIALRYLEAGFIDAVVVDEVFGRYYINQSPKQYRILPEDLGVEEYAIGVRKEDTALMDKLNKAIAKAQADGRIKIIYDKWFGFNKWPENAGA